MGSTSRRVLFLSFYFYFFLFYDFTHFIKRTSRRTRIQDEIRTTNLHNKTDDRDLEQTTQCLSHSTFKILILDKIGQSNLLVYCKKDIK